LEKNLRAVPNNSPNEIVRFPFGYSLVVPNTVTVDRNERTSMDMAARVGEGCYHTTKELAQFTGLSERAVCTHIENAAKLGWLKKSQHGFRGQKWKLASS
jgi:hypothetical protein